MFDANVNDFFTTYVVDSLCVVLCALPAGSYGCWKSLWCQWRR